MHRIVNDEALDTLFRAARSRHAWLERPVSDTMLRALWELVKLGPTSGIAVPARVLFVRSNGIKARLTPAVAPPERTAVLTAPIVAIVGRPLDGAAAGGDRQAAARRDAVFESAYLVLASRALGLDCGPIWDFDRQLVDAAVFPDGTVASNFLCALGYGDESKLSHEGVKPDVAEACGIL